MSQKNEYRIRKREKMEETFSSSPPSIDVGRGPLGPSIEGPFCRTVHLFRTLGEKKVEKKKKKRKNEEKRIKTRKKRNK